MKRLFLLMAMAISFQLQAQLTVEGEIFSALPVEAVVHDHDGRPTPVELKQIKSPQGYAYKYACTFSARNLSYRLSFHSGSSEAVVHIFTHQPDLQYDKWFEPISIDFTRPFQRETVVYWSPSQGGYIWLTGITTEDANRLGEMNLWPRRIHPDQLEKQ